MTTIELELTGIAHGGEALGRHEGKVIFVPYAIPGERVRAEIVEDRPRWSRARLVEVLQASPWRVDPPCPYFGPERCGGCQWQHIDYEYQLQLKTEIVRDQLQRQARLAHPPVEDCLALADGDRVAAWAYRNHVEFQLDRAGRLALHKTDSQDLIAIDECLLLHPLLDELHASLELAGTEEGNQPVAIPGLQRMRLRAGVHTGQRQIVLEMSRGKAPELELDVPASVVVQYAGERTEALIGEPFIEEQVGERTFRISADSPFPVNTFGAEALVDLVTTLLEPRGHETLLDVYCGVGLFGLSLAPRVGQVIGVESSPSACEDFAWNAQELDNAVIHEGPAEEVLAVLQDRVDVSIVNPPRAGVKEMVIRELVRLRPRKLAYVSYDPASLARDVPVLRSSGYRLLTVQPLDLFPQTSRVASVALFAL